MPFNPPAEPLQVTKLDAAMRQTAAAIDAFERGAFDIAITLAGAAEGMLPEIEAQPLWRTLRDHPGLPEEIERKSWIWALNSERDWLKHSTTDLGEEIEITRYTASLMLLRALAKLPRWTPRMIEFKDWAMEDRKAHQLG